MTNAPTARQVLASLDARRTQAQIAALADLDSAAQDEVRHLLGSVKPGAHVDLRLLIESVRLRLTERREVAAARSLSDAPVMAARYELQLAGADFGALKMLPENEVMRLRDELRASGGSPGLPGLGTGRADVPDEEPDDLDDDDLDDDAKPKRRRVKRVPSKRAARKSKLKPEPRTSYLGPRLLNDSDRPFGASIDFDRNYVPMMPPWLIDDGDDDEEEN